MITLFAVTALLAALPVQDEAAAIKEQYGRHFEAQADDKLAELWRGSPGRILTTIDGDLEGSLALWEKSPGSPDLEQVARLHERALWGARIASRVTGQPIFADYAAAFVGWSPEEKKSFRAGQAAYGKARKALRGGEPEQALAAARECRDLALPLGDWWGTAMGWSAIGHAQSALGDHGAASAAFAQARLLYAQLGLAGSELECLAGLARSLRELGRTPRARMAAEEGARAALAAGQTDLARQMEEIAAELR